MAFFAFSGSHAALAASNAEVQFVQKLESVLSNGSLADALALFDTMPANLREDVDLNSLHASLLLSAGKTGDAEKIAVNLLSKEPKNIDVSTETAV